MKKSHGILLMGLLSVGAASSIGFIKGNEVAKGNNVVADAGSQNEGRISLPKRTKTAEVTNLDELKNALKTADEGTIIYVSEAITIQGGSTETLDGKGCTISVKDPYIKEDGSINENPTKMNLFTANPGSTLNLRNMTIIGGRDADADYQAALIYSANSKGTLENVTVTQSYRGINASNAQLVLKNCNIVRNAANNAGGIQAIGNSATLVFDGCSLSENYSTGSMGGGGAIELKSGGRLYANNSIFTNNYSTEIGGAINVYQGYIYLLNSTVSGNVTIQKGFLENEGGHGGGIGLNGSRAFSVINSVVDDNYYNNGSGRSDIGCYSIGSSDASKHEFINSVYGAIKGESVITARLTLKDTKEDTTSSFGRKYRNDGIRKPDGYSDPIAHPVAATKEAGKAALYIPLSVGKSAASGGVKTYFNYSNLNDIKVGYYNGTEIVPAVGLSAPAESDEVTTYYESGSRSSGVIGASGPTTEDFYTVKLGGTAENGHIAGVSVYGDTYLSGTKIKLKGIADEGYGLSKFTLTSDSSVDVTDNPYELTVNKDYTVTAAFLPGFPLAYDANGGSGDVPETLSFADGNSATVLAKPEGLIKSGYEFLGWNTAADGSGESKTAGQKLVINEAKTLYAQWEIKAAVQAAIDAINGIGTVEYTQACKDKIDAARALYNDLPAEDQGGVANYSTLTEAEAKYESLDKIKKVIDLIAALGDVEISSDYDSALAEIATKYSALTAEEKAAVTNYSVYEEKAAAVANVKNAIEKIDAIGEVSYPESGSKIDLAQAAYNNAGDYKNLVTNVAVLEAAIAKYESLGKIAEVEYYIDVLGDIEISEDYDNLIALIKEKYAALTEEEKAAVEGYDEVLAKEESVNKVKEVNGLISGLGNLEYSEAYENKLNTIDTKYDALTAEEKAIVVGYSGYQSKQESYDKIDAVVEKIESIGEVTLDSEASIKEAREGFDGLSEEEKGLIPTYEETLVKAEGDYAKLVEKNQNGKTLAIVFGIIGGIILLLVGAWALLMFALNKWIKVDGKAIRAFRFFGIKKNGKPLVWGFPFKFVTREESEIFKTKEEALK